MKIKLPIITDSEIKDGKIVTKRAEREFELDMSLGCQMRFEAHFPELAAKENFVDYAVRLKKLKSVSPAIILSKLKAVYCFFDTEMSFLKFVKLFDFSSPDYTTELTEKITEIFEIVLSASSEKN